MLTASAPASRDERGAVLAWFAIWLPVLVVFGTFVLDVGNWFEHRRHLQLQVDASALAGGSAWQFPCNESVIEGFARTYVGPHTSNTTAPYNAQVGGTPASRMFVLLNSINFWNEGGTDHSDGGGPCATSFLDVKGTERNLPWFLPFGGSLVPAINAQARVQIQGAAALANLLPLFVRDVNPESAAALFVDEATNTKLDAQYMTRADPGNCASGFSCWSNLTEPATITTAAPRTSLVIALSSLPRCSATVTSGCMSLAGTPNQICLQFATECYWADNSGVRGGVVFIRRWTDSSPPPCTSVTLNGVTTLTCDPPRLADVRLLGVGATGATCPDASFDYIETGSCTVRVEADVRVPSGIAAGDIRIQANGNDLTLSGGRYVGTITLNAPPNNPPTGYDPTVPVDITWAVRHPNGNSNVTIINGKGTCAANFGGSNPCIGDFGVVQRAFVGSDLVSGPIREVHVAEAAAPATFISSLQDDGTAKMLVASMTLAGATATAASDPPVRLRAVDSSQSAVDCENNVTFREEITLGCKPLYTFNTQLTATDPCDPPYGQNQSDLFQSPNPPAWQCVAVGPGASVGQFTDGLLGRILTNGALCTGVSCNTACPAAVSPPGFAPGRNYWNPSGANPDATGPYRFGNFPPGDPRIVELFMVPFGAFRDQGRALFPISNFGVFYITGWGGNGNANDPCPGADPNIPQGWLSGHFIKYNVPNTGGGTGQPCDFSDTNPCVVVLVK